jgi:hypothetical protein
MSDAVTERSPSDQWSRKDGRTAECVGCSLQNHFNHRTAPTAGMTLCGYLQPFRAVGQRVHYTRETGHRIWHIRFRLGQDRIGFDKGRFQLSRLAGGREID